MTFQYKAGSNKALFDGPADWISPNGEGGYSDDPPVNDGRKVVLSDTDHLRGHRRQLGMGLEELPAGAPPPVDGPV